MPYKNDNLEELFQNAAEDYPLNTNNSNWDSVSSKLNNIITKTSRKNLSVFYFVIFSLLLLGGTLVFYQSKFESQSLSPKQTKPANKENVINNVQQIQNLKQAVTNHSLSISSSTNKIENNVAYDNSKSKIREQINVQNNDAYLAEGINNKAHYQQQVFNYNKLNNAVNNFSFNKADDKSTKIEITNTPTLDDNSKTKESVASKNDVIKFAANPSRFYGSLYGGPEFSMVKFQHLANSGYQLGISLGYRINNRFDIEIGLQREHINYFTNGKYFEKSGLKLKDNFSLENVNGNSKITSVPVALKYNFLSRTYGHFYATAGVDAMMITHTERYNYVVSKDGDENDRSKNYNSVTGPKYFTAINASAGYETKLSNWCNMEIEPYYQLPISNIGVGKVPVTSFGINIGIVKDLK
ncbi:MAG: hypothetical protein ABJB05_11945 [Parafilimonas sp.]